MHFPFALLKSFDDSHPNITYFAESIGWIEIGYVDDSPLTSFIRANDPGGMVWEGKDQYKNLTEAFQDLEKGLGEWMLENGIE